LIAQASSLGAGRDFSVAYLWSIILRTGRSGINNGYTLFQVVKLCLKMGLISERVSHHFYLKTVLKGM
jgi:hypothetical protein